MAGLAPGEHDDPVGARFDPAGSGHMDREGFPERRDPRRIRVVGVAPADGGDPGLVDVGSAVEVRFADGERDDLHAAGARAGHVLADLEGVFGPHLAEAPGEEGH